MRPSNNLENKTLSTVELFPTFLDTGTANKTFQQSRKQDFFRHILKSSASMYQISGSQFFRTAPGTQSGSHAFDESRFVIIFLSILRVMEILHSFRLVLEGEQVKRY